MAECNHTTARRKEGKEIARKEKPISPQSQTRNAKGSKNGIYDPERNNQFHLPGNSVSDVGERMNGGAVKEDKSPENDAILISAVAGSVGTARRSRDDLSVRFQEGGPRSTLTRWNSLSAQREDTADGAEI